MQLSELREAAETAEVAITAHTQQMDKLSEQLRGRCEEVARLEASIEAMKKDLEAKDKRIQHLDRSKLTVEQVERIQKLKKDHQHALDEVRHTTNVAARAMSYSKCVMQGRSPFFFCCNAAFTQMVSHLVASSALCYDRTPSSSRT